MSKVSQALLRNDELPVDQTAFVNPQKKDPTIHFDFFSSKGLPNLQTIFHHKPKGYSENHLRRLAKKFGVCGENPQRACYKEAAAWFHKATEFVQRRKYVSAKWSLKYALNPAVNKENSIYSTELLNGFMKITQELIRLDRDYFQLRRNDMRVNQGPILDWDPAPSEPSEIMIVEVLGDAYHLKDRIIELKRELNHLPEHHSDYATMQDALLAAYDHLIAGTNSIIEKYI